MAKTSKKRTNIISFGVCVILLITFIYPNIVMAETASGNVITPASLSFDDVQNAINEAKDGEIVLLPEGDVVWTKRLSIVNKGITLKGQGVDKTIIHCEEKATQLDLKVCEGKPFRITGIEFHNLHIYMNGKVHGWRIDHCNFINDENTNVLRLTQISNGVMDHCSVTNGNIVCWGGGANANGNESWKTPLRLGSADSPYIEDCIFDHNVYGCVVDASHGGKYVFRNNISYNGFITAHSLQNTKTDGTFGRGTRSYEIYNNKIMSVDKGNGLTNFRAIFVRAGTGVIYNNEVNNISGDPFEVLCAIDNLRSYRAQDFLGMADGTSPYDGNDPQYGNSGYPALDQIGRSTDAGEGDLYHPQLSEPLYGWNNTFNGKPRNITLGNTHAEGNLIAEHIKEGRDYYNTVHPSYEAYTYPHPLVSETVLELTCFKSEGNTKYVGEELEITWKQPDSDLLKGNVVIELYKGETKASDIATTDVATGIIKWTIPETTVKGTDYKIRIYQGAISDDSQNFQIVLSGDIEVKGDMNGDGDVDIVDLAYVARYIDMISTDDGWDKVKKADMNNDNSISIVDLSTVARLIK